MQNHSLRFHGLIVKRYQDGRPSFDEKLPHGYRIEVVPGKPPYSDLAADEVSLYGDGLAPCRVRLPRAETLTGLLERGAFTELSRELREKAVQVLESLGLKPDLEPERIKTGEPDITHWGTVEGGMRLQVFFPRQEPVEDLLSLASIRVDVDPSADLELNAKAPGQALDWLVERGFLPEE